MSVITCKNAYYVKLGEKGKWEKSSIEENLIRIGWPKQTLQDINNGAWSTIQKQLQKATPHKATATRDLTALQQICKSTGEDIWITFYKNQLWWCKVCEREIFNDEISKFRKMALSGCLWTATVCCANPWSFSETSGI